MDAKPTALGVFTYEVLLSHFADEEIKAQREQVICPRLHS